MPTPRPCTVSLRDLDGVTHTVRVQGSSLYEAAARAVAAFREQGWAADALTATATLRVEVHVPAIVHEVPLRAVERWLRSERQSEGRGGEDGYSVSIAAFRR